MKVDTAYKVDTNIEQRKQFQIETSSKAFEILSSNIYKNPLRAIIRELAANAWDAHWLREEDDPSSKATSIPFEITVPSALAPELIIKDYGPGLSPKAIFQLYTVYFASDKTWTDELIGGMGLGSKTPFSYTDSFTVVSRHKGERHMFACFLDEHKTPCVSLLNTTPLDDQNDSGLTITVPCSATTEVKDNLDAVCWFPTKPKLFNAELPELDIAYQDDDFALVKPENSYYHRNSKIHVLMGNILYYVDETRISEHNFDIYFKVPIGTYKPAASRETLTGVSISDFEDKIEEVSAKYVQTMLKMLDDPKLNISEVLGMASGNHWNLAKKHPRVLKIINAWDVFTSKWDFGGYSSDVQIDLYDINSADRIYLSGRGHRGGFDWFRSFNNVNKSTASKVIVVPKKEVGNFPHVKLMTHHFEQAVKDDSFYCIRIAEDKMDDFLKDLRKVISQAKEVQDAVYDARDFSIPKTVRAPAGVRKTSGRPTKKKPLDINNLPIMSPTYQDIYINKEEMHYYIALDKDPDKYVYQPYERRDTLQPWSNYGVSFDWIAVAQAFDLEGIIFIPDTAVLRKQFQKREFVTLEEYVTEHMHEFPHLCFNFTDMTDKLRDTQPRVRSNHYEFKVKRSRLINEWYKTHQSFTGYARVNDWISRNCRKMWTGADGVQGLSSIHAHAQFRRLVELGNRIINRYPRLNEYGQDTAGSRRVNEVVVGSERNRRRSTPRITVNDYMRYEDERRSSKDC